MKFPGSEGYSPQTPKEEALEEELEKLEEKHRMLDLEKGLDEWHIETLEQEHGIDHLTGAKTREAFNGELDRMLKFVRGETDAHRAGIEPIGEVSLVFIDLDNFGQVNKSIGHDAGDEVLKKAVGLIRSSIRETDTLGRFGGDEFLVLLPRANEETAKERADAILANLQSDAELQGLGVGASIGVCSSNLSTDPAELVRLADEASRKAKQGGKGRVEVYGE